MKFSHILLILDSNTSWSPATRRALELAQHHGAKLTICEVVESLPAQYLRTIVAVTPREILDSVVAESFDRLTTLLETVETNGMSVEIEVLKGKPHIEIARLVRKNGHDLVIKSIAEHRAKRTQSISRADRMLMRHCPCPLWLVNSADLPAEAGILVALDMPADDEACARFNERILRISRSIAVTEFRPLHVVHAWSLVGEGHRRARGELNSDVEVNRMIALEAARRADWLRETVNRAGSGSERVATDYLAPELHVVKGNAAHIVPALAEKVGAGLIVMGTAGRSGLSGVVVGNTSEMVLSRSDRSLLVVKEPDTPVGVAELPSTAQGRMREEMSSPAGDLR